MLVYIYQVLSEYLVVLPNKIESPWRHHVLFLPEVFLGSACCRCCSTRLSVTTTLLPSSICSEIMSAKRQWEATSENEEKETEIKRRSTMENGTCSIVTAPFFHYINRSSENDKDPLTPLAPMARVPTFPAKIYGEIA